MLNIETKELKINDKLKRKIETYYWKKWLKGGSIYNDYYLFN